MTEQVTQALSAINNPNRLAVLRWMKERKTVREFAVANFLGTTQSHASQCLKKLQGAGLVERIDDAQHSPYAITKAGRKTLTAVTAIEKGLLS